MSAKKAGMVTRKKVKTPLRERAQVSAPKVGVSITKVLLVCFVMMAGFTAYGSFKAIDTVLSVPVEEVKVSGQLQFQDQLDIKTVINRYTDNGFVQVDLEKLHHELVALPWMNSVSIKRELPNGLLIELHEEKAAAFWNNDALINQQGKVFTPEVLPVIEGLPIFSGKNHQQVLSLYSKVQALLPETQKPVRELHINHRNTVQVVLANEIILVMQLKNIDQQVTHWMQLSSNLAAEKIQNMKKVDLRYSNGAAVEWKEQLALAATDKRGGHY